MTWHDFASSLLIGDQDHASYDDKVGSKGSGKQDSSKSRLISNLITGLFDVKHDDVDKVLVLEDVIQLRRTLGTAESLADRLMNQRTLLVSLADLILEGLDALIPSSAMPTLPNSLSKYEGLEEACYGSMADFFGGINAIIGHPNPDLRATVEAEHRSENSFIAENYGLNTNPRKEFLLVFSEGEVEPVPRVSEAEVFREKCSPGNRTWFNLAGFMNDIERMTRLMQELSGLTHVTVEDVKSLNLLPEEVGCARMYTGPMFVEYNAALREAGRRARLTETERAKEPAWQCPYVTTLHLIASLVVKVSRLQQVKPLYRGLQRKMPERFNVRDKFLVRGGVEFAFCSCSTDKQVAVGYSSGAVLLSIQTGAVTRGASLSWLSYYPEENEVLLPPCTALEVLGTPCVGDYVEVRLLATSHPGAFTIEQLVSRRKQVIIEVCRLLMSSAESGGRSNALSMLMSSVLTAYDKGNANQFTSDTNFVARLQGPLQCVQALPDESVTLQMGLTKAIKDELVAAVQVLVQFGADPDQADAKSKHSPLSFVKSRAISRAILIGLSERDNHPSLEQVNPVVAWYQNRLADSVLRLNTAPSPLDAICVGAALQDVSEIIVSGAAPPLFSVGMFGFVRLQDQAIKLPPVVFQRCDEQALLALFGEISDSMNQSEAKSSSRRPFCMPNLHGSGSPSLQGNSNVFPFAKATSIAFEDCPFLTQSWPATVGFLSRLPTLNCLRLLDCKFGPAQIVELSSIISSIDSLTVLNIQGNDFGQDGTTAFCGCLRKLSSLTLRDNNLHVVSLMAALSEAWNLTFLCLAECNLADMHAYNLETALQSTGKLTALDISNNLFTVEGAKLIIAAFEQQPALESADLSNNQLDLEGVEICSEIASGIPSLKSLFLGNGADVKNVLGAQHRRKPQKLSRSKSRVAEDSIDTVEAADEKIRMLRDEVSSLKERLADTTLKAVASARPPSHLKLGLRRALKRHYAKIFAIYWARHDPNILVSASQDGKCLVWNTEKSTVLTTISLRSSWVMTCAMSPSGKLVATAGLDNAVTLYNQGRVVRELTGHLGYVTCARFIGNDRIVSSSGDGTCLLTDVETGVAIDKFDDTGDVMSVDPSPIDRNRFISGGVSGTSKLWDVRLSKCVKTFTGHDSDVNAVKFFMNGRFFVSGSDDGSVKLFDVRTNGALETYEGTAGITSVTVSDSGKFIISGADDFSATIWDTATATVAQELKNHDNRVASVGLNSNGALLATGCWDSVVRVFG
eukprot:c20554_g1_i5.p1 GENE.c20554_g1_i5~~c20554_g1_i5.p1  ORF type:complete len:1253 (+),score=274.45 c20554_g1_i5:80-3838(+)